MTLAGCNSWFDVNCRMYVIPENQVIFYPRRHNLWISINFVLNTWSKSLLVDTDYNTYYLFLHHFKLKANWSIFSNTLLRYLFPLHCACNGSRIIHGIEPSSDTVVYTVNTESSQLYTYALSQYCCWITLAQRIILVVQIMITWSVNSVHT